VFTALKNVLVFILSIVGMIGGAIFMAVMLESRVGFYIGGVLGFVLMYFIAQMIAEKSLNIFVLKAKFLIYFGGIMICMYVVMVLVTTFGMGFYVNRVPQAENVHSVSFQHQWGRNVTGFVTDGDIIARTIDIHNEILNSRSYLRRVHWESMGSHNHQSFPITYILQDGTRIYRQYMVTQAFMERHGITDLLNAPAVVLARQPFFQNTEHITGINIEIFNGREDNIFVYVSGQARIASLIEAVKEDHLRERTWQEGSGSDVQRSWLNLNAQLQPQQGNTQQNTWMSATFFEEGAVASWLREHGFMD